MTAAATAPSAALRHAALRSGAGVCSSSSPSPGTSVRAATSSGIFPAGWSEWNDRFRDTMRAFWRGDRRSSAPSPSVSRVERPFPAPRPQANRDRQLRGVTRRVHARGHGAYNERHNQANLENGADGHPHNLSWNHGAEGPSEDPVSSPCGAPDAQFPGDADAGPGRADAAGRRRDWRARSAATTTPIDRTTRSRWLDWSGIDDRLRSVDFARHMIRFRRSRPGLRRDTFLKGAKRGASAKDVSWLHPAGRELLTPTGTMRRHAAWAR